MSPHIIRENYQDLVVKISLSNLVYYCTRVNKQCW